ncbi:alkylhydroperoxidase AhpD family core domain-containing protein [Frankia sp. EI5c]|uniref:carboxymuconolactone decarboxylase family protein n=1 Tax=Frankia sp. EI5c TaxID=683316 RepID=UPI0007C31BE6|nr:carboxymuconolactone decarboxylase family protein [Frankia sp. EI5c]OAA25823.1 alkylhydroperoxidase AhpD family core domain-containing protein [Frankia sp. EI5c]
MTASPARIAPIPVEEWNDDAKETLPRYLRRPELFDPSRPDALPMPTSLRLFAHHIRLTEPWLAFSEVLVGKSSVLDPKHRELVILRVAWLTRSDYEWTHHVRIGRACGITTEQIHAIPEGAAAGVWTPLERAMVAAVDQMLGRFRVDDETWQALAAELDTAQLLELSFVIGSYCCLAQVFNNVGLNAEPPTEPLDAPAIPALED